MNSSAKKPVKLFVLIHGLTPVTMRGTMAGYACVLAGSGVPPQHIMNIGYHARGKTLEQVGTEARRELVAKIQKLAKSLPPNTNVELHVIAHSLGGLVLRDIARYIPITSVIMLGTPNSGIFWTGDIPKGDVLGTILFGGTIVESAKSGGYVTKLDRMYNTKVVTIAGTKQFTWWNPLSWLASACLKGNHDGFVPAKSIPLGNHKNIPMHIDHLAMVTSPKFILAIVEMSIKMSGFERA